MPPETALEAYKVIRDNRLIMNNAEAQTRTVSEATLHDMKRI